MRLGSLNPCGLICPNKGTSASRRVRCAARGRSPGPNSRASRLRYPLRAHRACAIGRSPRRTFSLQPRISDRPPATPRCRRRASAPGDRRARFGHREARRHAILGCQHHRAQGAIKRNPFERRRKPRPDRKPRAWNVLAEIIPAARTLPRGPAARRRGTAWNDNPK